MTKKFSLLVVLFAFTLPLSANADDAEQTAQQTAQQQVQSQQQLQAQFQAQIDQLIGQFQEQWTSNTFQYPAGVTDNELATAKVELKNACDKNMAARFQSDRSLQNLTFPLDFEARLSKGGRKRLLPGTTDQSEFYKTVERYHVTAKVTLGPDREHSCITTCDTVTYTVDGAQRNRTNGCTAKPIANAASPTYERLPDINEFVSISGWQPLVK